MKFQRERKWIMKILKIRKITICLTAVVLFFGVSCSAVLAVTDDDRIRALEKRIEELEKQKSEQRMDSAVKDKFAGKSVSPMHSFWDNDFYISTQDENFWMKIRGNLHVDTKFYGGNSHNPTHFDIRRGGDKNIKSKGTTSSGISRSWPPPDRSAIFLLE